MSGFPAYERISAELGIKTLARYQHVMTMMMPCEKCGAGIGRSCMTIDGKNPGTKTPQHHIARIRSGSALFQIWLRSATEAFERIDNREVAWLDKMIDRS